ncbi:MAG: NAD(P)H-hydrate dehydratase [Selenomonadaceae bacterium]|nr:NAD(P)H-hydrate dehydratase [Selenomonadaceae bacterium]
MKISLVEEMRGIDAKAGREYGITELVLMENAGHRTAEAVVSLLGQAEGKSVIVLAGTGNNGGDAFAAARHLVNAGARVKIFLVGEPDHLAPSAARNRATDEKMGIEIYELTTDRAWDRLNVSLRFADIVVDGILGTGIHGELKKPVLRLIETVNASQKTVVSIDIPSGVQADTGAVTSVAIRAAATLTLGLPKPGHFLCPGAACTGELLVDDIGLPLGLLTDAAIRQTLLDDELAKTLLPERPLEAHKGMCGRILVIAGSRGMTGAAYLASLAALKAGAGLVTLAVPESLHDLMEQKTTEVMTVPVPETKPGSGVMGGDKALGTLLELTGDYDAILMGPGLGRAPETGELVRKLAAYLEKPMVLDADAIFAFHGHLKDLARCKQVPVLTPHLGELAALLGIEVAELRSDLVAQVRKAAADLQCLIVAKSECTLVAYPQGEVFFTSKGNPGMATAGCGDVLAGTIIGLMEQTESGLAPLLGVYLHGLAGDLAAAKYGEGLTATDVLAELPAARLQLRRAQHGK